VTGMALTPAEKQKRYRDRLKAADQVNPDAIEQVLLHEVARHARRAARSRTRSASLWRIS